jgi:FG-GAP-like repeat
MLVQSPMGESLRNGGVAPVLALLLGGCSALAPTPPADEGAARLSAESDSLLMTRLELPAGSRPTEQLIVVADVNGDAALDALLVPRNGGRSARVALQSSDGQSASLSDLAGVQASCVEQALARDFDGDGDQDLVLATCQGVRFYRNAWVERHLVAFDLASDLGLDERGWPSALVAFDADGDGDTDLLVLHDPGTPAGSTRTRLWGNRLAQEGHLRFAEVPGAVVAQPHPGGAHIVAASALDANGDGRPDVYAARDGRDLLLVQQPDGTFVDEGDARGLTGFAAERGLVVGDLDGDGDADVATVSPDGQVTLEINDGGGGFAAHALAWPRPYPATGLALADLDGDAHPDLLVASGNHVIRNHVLRFTGVEDGVPAYQDVGAHDYELPAPAASVDVRSEGGQLGLALAALLPQQSSYLYVVRYFPKPRVECVTRFTDTQFSAKFGYENPFGTSIQVPRGATNFISPTPAPKDPPIPIDRFEAGSHSEGFWVPFAGGEIRWTVGKRSAVASSVSTPRCQDTDYRPVATNDVPLGFGEGPAPPPQKPSAPAPGFGELHPAELVPARAKRTGITVEDFTPRPLPDRPLPFKIIFTHFKPGEDGGFANPDLFASVQINGGPLHWVDLGEGDDNDPWQEINVEVSDVVSSGQDSVPVQIKVFDRDNASRDDLEITMDAHVDNHSGAIGGGYTSSTPGESRFFFSGPGSTCALNATGWGACIRAEPAGKPHVDGNLKVCASWKATFDDAGHGEDRAAAAPGALQLLPASFAHAKLMLSTVQEPVAWEGVLDRDGCIPEAERLPIDLFITPADRNTQAVDIQLVLTTSLEIPGFRYDVRVCHGSATHDPDDTNCELGGVGTTDPAHLNHQASALVGWTARNAWLVPPQGLQMNPAILHPATRVAAVMGLILAAPDNGVPTNLANPIVVSGFADKACEFCGLKDTCAGNIKGIHAASKYTVAHEIGHQIEQAAVGLPNATYTFAKQGGAPSSEWCLNDQLQNDPPDTPELCTCNAVEKHNSLHCLQSLETSSAAQVEGFAHFYASKAFNDLDESACVFTYYKQMQLPSCPAGFTCTPRGNLFVIQPPFPVSCKDAVKWRNSHCGVPQFGIEWDWLTFYWNLNTSGPAKLAMPELYGVYRQACGGVSCNGHDTNWTTLENAAQTVFGARDPKALNFIQQGNSHGVSTSL